MKKFELAGVEINKVSISDLLFNKSMLIAYVLLAIGVYGIYEMIIERYFAHGLSLLDISNHIGQANISHNIKEVIFGHGGEVKREAPWTLYIANYMFMIYSGSGIIFLVALAELFNIEIIKKTAAGFMTLGLCIVFGGLFTIAMDLNILNMQWMFLSPNIGAGMWLMLPLYSIYIPFVIFEIYLLITKKQGWVKKIAFGILLLSVAIDVVEYYIQAKLFDMNIARHLWTTYPNLTLYFIISAFVASCGIMLLYSYIQYKKVLKDEFATLTIFLKKITLVSIIALASYEAIAFLFIDKKWANVILFGDFKYDFYIYTIFAIALPFGLLSFKLFKKKVPCIITVVASILIIIGTYIGRLIFVYGGNAYPMSDRFGTGFEKYGEYEIIKDFIFFSPTLTEVFIVIGSVGVIILTYTILDKLFSVSKIREHH
jgi:Ni/Fe-hydrogenase subunit HybB-like protein